jgi:hypothetical protein
VPAEAWDAAMARASWFDLERLEPSRIFFRPRRIADSVLLFPDDRSPVEQHHFLVDSPHGDTISFGRVGRSLSFILRRSKDCIPRGRECLKGDADCECGWRGGSDDAGEGSICACPRQP